MVGTAQVYNYTIFIKKIGYSVGLESLLSRATMFGEAYAAVPTFRESDWARLVHSKEGWNLMSRHVADVFAELGIVRIKNKEVFAGPVGEALGVCRKLLGDEEYKRACEYLVALAIVQADGDIFLNALRSWFDKDQVASSLIGMIREKRAALFDVFNALTDQELLAAVVSIDRQRSNKGGGSVGGLEAAARTVPLSEATEGLGLPQPVDTLAIEPPSSDYLNKICVSRKGWAESLKLFENGELTDRGIRFLGRLSEMGLASPDGTFCVWPTKFEVELNQFDAGHFGGIKLLSTWEFQRAVFEALGGTSSYSRPSIDAVREGGRLIRAIYGAYRELSQSWSMIRNEVSSHVITSVALARAAAWGEPAPNMECILASQELKSQGIVIRSSTTIESAVSVRSHGNQNT